MDGPEPDTTPFDAITTQGNKLMRQYQTYLDKSTPYVSYRWSATGALLVMFFLRIIIAQGWYIVAYCLGIYLLNLFLAFLQPKFDPSLSQDEGLEDGEGSELPTKQDDEFRPFIRRLPEFKFWHAATRAVTISFLCSWFEIFNLPVFWPVLVMYWLILFSLTMRRQIQHMIKYRYVPFSFGKAKYARKT
ncbi:hypothetical protein LTR10_023603 [Elasticomyces elasticus]|uniref:Protein RER1 n=1 Tax=Exophiala sideris TaxID=1016849 RepID=A0ABR0JGX8_9EURO|nr:hypothetical protein LTR10_023603 [Elasticomyces elasticus]KAK5033378.1 hypothetical protein LTS07_003680 [Exophiala sideris]KAK5042127.1 hypothetical protein LTR13_001933 [Exophiala sideris]KAK5063922.1 hypothetical protein LTR69_003688 [Exophiala sideris]KAK5185395.1 hypothetical protein LTR44_002384 [Eurotiomycetes sp. CCFEE 6388]